MLLPETVMYLSEVIMADSWRRWKWISFVSVANLLSSDHFILASSTLLCTGRTVSADMEGHHDCAADNRMLRFRRRKQRSVIANSRNSHHNSHVSLMRESYCFNIDNEGFNLCSGCQRTAGRDCFLGTVVTFIGLDLERAGKKPSLSPKMCCMTDRGGRKGRLVEESRKGMAHRTAALRSLAE